MSQLDLSNGISPTDSAFATSPDKEAACKFVLLTSAGAHNRRRIHKSEESLASRNDGTWMDKERKNLQAYEYLCRIEAMIHQDIGAIEDLGEELRNGIYLAYLAKSFHAESVKRIFEDRTRLQYRHSDNINYLFQAMRSIGLPEVFIFELTDLYDKKNIPKVIYCIHALSHLLFRKGLAPHISNLSGKLQFTDETLESTQQNLDEAGVAMPAFGNIETALQKELKEEETEEQKRQKFLDSKRREIVRTQAQARGYLARKNYRKQQQFYKSHEKQAVRIQATWKGQKQRKAYLARLNELKAHESTFVKLQARIRGNKSRDEYNKRKNFYKDHLKEIVKIQAMWKAKKMEKAYKALSSFSNPDVKTVQAFLHLLDDNDHDYNEEIEIEMLRQKVVKMIRENNQTEVDLGELDNKIALLVKNRISLEEVVHMTSKKMKAKLHQNEVDQSTSSVPSLRGHDKETRQKLEHYQHLFYLLQTQPDYLAKMMWVMNNKSGGNVTKLLEGYVMALYGYAQNAREEYLLLQLITACIKVEISHIKEIDDFWRSNPLFIKLVLHYTRGAKERQYIRELLQPLLKDVFAQAELDLETDPVNIYRALIREEEMATGEKSTRNYDVTPSEAAQDPDVKRIQAEHAQKLVEVASKFVEGITSSIKKMPFGIRYISMMLRDSLRASFKTQEEEITRSIGNLLYYRYMNPAIISPETFDVLEVNVTQNQRKTLGEISKILHLVSVKKQFTDEEQRPAVLNQFILEGGKQFWNFFREASEVVTAEEFFGMNEYVDLGRHRKPVIYISPSEIYEIHRNLTQFLDDLELPAEDNIRTILNDLGAPPPVVEGYKEAGNGNEITLVLSNRFAALEDSHTAENNLMLREAKRLIFTVLRVQSGKTLVEILESDTSPRDEVIYTEVVMRDKQREENRREQNPRDSRVNGSNSNLNKVPLSASITDLVTGLEGTASSFAELKSKTLKLTQELEKRGLIKRTNNFQDILNDIARDMLHKHRRRRQRARELQSLQTTLASLMEKQKYLEEQKKSYNDYVSACMSQFNNKKGKSKKPALFSKQYFHMKELQKSGKVPQFGSYKYTGDHLYKKGVLISIEDCPVKQFDKVTLTISSDEAGVFQLEASFLNMQVEKAEIRLEDLLQAQYENISVMGLFDGVAKVNVNLLVYLINKKFYT